MTTAVREQETQARATGNDTRRNNDAYAHLTPLFHELVDPAQPEENRKEARETLVAGYMDVATHIAQRFAQRGQPVEDLAQVASLGLVNAIDRFDPARGKDFLSFAVPTITGEVRRYFRDHSWAMRVPRRLQELRSSINKAVTKLGQELGRAPTPSELAEHLGVDVEEVHEGYQAGAAYRTSSLDELASNDEDSTSTVEATVGVEDHRLSTVDDQVDLYPAMAQLSERDRNIVWMRFFENMTQTQIANRMGISQMHISRLLSRSLVTLREVLAKGHGEQSGIQTVAS